MRQPWKAYGRCAAGPMAHAVSARLARGATATGAFPSRVRRDWQACSVQQVLLPIATGVVLLVEGDSVSIAGTCFPFRDRSVFLTAAHCVPVGIEVVVLQGRSHQRRALAIQRHPSCDIALIRTEPGSSPYDSDSLAIISAVASDLLMGGDFLTFGHPVEGGVEARATGRLLKGHFQRYFSYMSPSGRSYWAGEMSVATPAGHSGGPVVRATAPHVLDGIVTANYDSYVVLDQVEEVEDENRVLRIESRRIVTYGITAMASNFSGWLAEQGLS